MFAPTSGRYGLSKVIASQAGGSLRSECDAYTKAHGALGPGDVAVTSAGKLPCEQVLHTTVPKFDKADPVDS